MAKYDLWPNLLAACQGRNIPIHVFAAAPSSTRPNPTPSTPALWRLATTISVQDAAAADAFAQIGLKDNVSVDGDPRVERVLTRSANPDKVWSRLGRFGGTSGGRRKHMARRGARTALHGLASPTSPRVGAP